MKENDLGKICSTGGCSANKIWIGAILIIIIMIMAFVLSK